MHLLLRAVAAALFLATPALALDIVAGSVVTVTGAADTQVFRFPDGRIAVDGPGSTSIWSSDGGTTWAIGSRGPAQGGEKAAIALGGYEVLSIYRTTIKQVEAPFLLPQRRSLDNWATVADENATVDTPLAVPLGGDAGDAEDGMLFHHGVIHSKDGRLIGTMYGNYAGDVRLADGYPAVFNFRKYRTVAVFSSDRGHSWGAPVTIAYDKMLARGTDPDAQSGALMPVPAVTQEGFDEADLVRAQNGDILAFMRSGGRLSPATAPISPTPLYMSRSADDGATWEAPRQIAGFGSSPNAVTLGNGIIVVTYARPGGWLLFSEDDGATWISPTLLSTSDAYTDIVQTGYDSFLAFYFDNGVVKAKSYTARRTGQAGAAGVRLEAVPAVLAAGEKGLLTWFGANVRNCILSGGPWGSGANASASSWAGPSITATTTFKLRCEWTADASVHVESTQTVTVQ